MSVTLHTYTKTEYKNAPDHKTTPLNATNLNNSEDGIENAYTDIAAVYSEQTTEDAKRALKSDLASISETGSTASQAISTGTFFYLNGTLVRAKTAIASGATFTLNTNYAVVTAGALNIGKSFLTYRGQITCNVGNGGISCPGWKVGKAISLTIEGTTGMYFVALRTEWSSDDLPTFNIRQTDGNGFTGTLNINVIYEI